MKIIKASSLFTMWRIWSAGRNAFSGGFLKRYGQRIVFFFGLLRYVREMHHFLDASDNPLLYEELMLSDVAIEAAGTPYVHANWNVLQRIQMIGDHYRQIAVGAARHLHFPADQYWECAEYQLPENKLRVVIDKPHWMRAEGEVAVSLFLGADRIYSVTFLLRNEQSKQILQVGAIQGRKNSNSKAQYAELTSAMHGLRPRDLAVVVTQMLACAIGCQEVWAISDDCHHMNRRSNLGSKFAAYDEIWKENGGIINGQGFYVLPVEFHRRDISQIASKKRAQYRRRYEALDDIQAQIAHAFFQDRIDLKRH